MFMMQEVYVRLGRWREHSVLQRPYILDILDRYMLDYYVFSFSFRLLDRYSLDGWLYEFVNFVGDNECSTSMFWIFKYLWWLIQFEIIRFDYIKNTCMHQNPKFRGINGLNTDKFQRIVQLQLVASSHGEKCISCLCEMQFFTLYECRTEGCAFKMLSCFSFFSCNYNML